MSNFTFYTTDKGLALSAKAEAGTTLNFTRCAVGTGTLGADNDPMTFTDLITRQQYMAINSISASGSKAKIITTLSNEDLTTGFYIREIGIYAADPDEGEILYAYGYTASPDYLPATGNNVVEQQYDLYIIVSSTAEITATLGDSTIYAPAEALEDHIEENVYDSGGVHGFETDQPTDDNNEQMLVWNKSNSRHVYSDNAPTATKLATARTVALTGDVTGSGSFDGSANLIINTSLSSEMDYIIEHTTTPTGWYRKWASGWIEQGGTLSFTPATIGGNRSISKIITLPTPMTSTTYTGLACSNRHTAAKIVSRTATSITVEIHNLQDDNGTTTSALDWVIKGK